jgi:hypothetical protein
MAGKKKARNKAANGESKSVIDRLKYQYEQSDVKTASGKRKTVDNGDDVAQVLRGKTAEEALTIAELNGATRDQIGNWKTKNPGMVRMNVGNFLRGVARKGGKIKVSGRKSVETKEVSGTAEAA